VSRKKKCPSSSYLSGKKICKSLDRNWPQIRGQIRGFDVEPRYRGGGTEVIVTGRVDQFIRLDPTEFAMCISIIQISSKRAVDHS
jgi:hypothetical protein